MEKGSTILDDLIKDFRKISENFTDYRTGKNTQYEIADAVMSGFSVFFMQSESFLEWQRRMNDEEESSNMKTLFRVEKIPGDTQIRNILDHISPEEIYPMWMSIIQRVKSKGQLEKFTGYNGNYLIAMDGTKYHSSEKIHCKNCSTRTTNGEKRYFHYALSPALVQSGPSKNMVLVLEPEFITPQDGYDKQDCENAAAKRWLLKYGKKYKGKGTILGDALYACETICRQILSEGLDFILICKPGSSPYIFQNELPMAETLNDIKIIEERVWNASKNRGEKYQYRYINKIRMVNPGYSKEEFRVNYCELTIKDERTDKVIYHNSFVTNFEITDLNVRDIIRDGRSRWSVENGDYNILKNHGYHGEHNFGHGDQYLSSTLFTLNLLAFLFHTTLELIDPVYQGLLKKFKSHYHLFTQIQEMSIFFIFTNWQLFFELIGRPKDQKVSAEQFLNFLNSLS